MKKTLRQLLILLLSFPCVLVWYSANAQEKGTAVTNQQQPAGKSTAHASYTRKGADTCAMCHDEDSALPVFPITMTKHAQPADERTPFARLQCESCHGPGAAHAKWVQPGEKQAPINTFGANSQLTTAQQNAICLGCHRGGERIAWHSSLHDESNVSCTRCHRIHVARDPVLQTRTQPTVCYQCHKKARSDFLKPSKHPVRFGKMACSDCHQVHGGSSQAALKQPTLNQTCFTCHAEKRGPLLWEHSPVTEDCGICHDAHGSVHPALLKKRAPLLCQQCHSQFGHPSVPRSAGGLPGATPSTFLLAGSCMNCHSHIHGSNHPSGAMFMR